MSEVTLFDTHTHLNDPDLYDQAQVLIEQAISAGVRHLVVPGYDMLSSRQAIELSERFSEVYAAVGVHPHDAKTLTASDLHQLDLWCDHEKVVAVGEIGLDYHYDNSPRDVQQDAFLAQIDLAKKKRLPIIIHDREAHADILQILRNTDAVSIGGIMHCFSGSVELMRECLQLNFYISLGGPITFKNAKKPAQVALEVPLDRLLIETDAPWLSPEPFRGKQNHPANVRLVAQKIAELRGMPIEEIGAITTDNALRIFGLQGSLSRGLQNED